MSDLVLTRKSFLPSGIFGELHSSGGSLIAFTLEHSYSLMPKIPGGTFVCVLGWHQLRGMSTPFQTFEIMVQGHSQILFHKGNYNADSEGCVLVGAENWRNKWLLESGVAFKSLLELQAGVAQFILSVTTASVPGIDQESNKPI